MLASAGAAGRSESVSGVRDTGTEDTRVQGTHELLHRSAVLAADEVDTNDRKKTDGICTH